MRRVLILTYYWPPAGSSGVQRWLKFVKYLREFGWEPIIYTANNPEAAAFDDSLKNDVPDGIKVIRRNVPEPYKIYKFITGNKGKNLGVGFTTVGSKKSGVLNKLAIWIRGNFFIPDARMFWIRPSTKFLTKYLKENPVELIISTGPPHSLHLIANNLKKKYNVPWIADFRDPWTEIYFYKSLKLTPFADSIQKRLELKVLRNADINVVVSKSMANSFKQKGINNIEVITNGYDHTDYDFEAMVDSKFSLVHIGTIPPDSNSPLFWKALSRMVDSDSVFKENLVLRFVGDIDSSVADLLEKNDLLKYVERVTYKPHSEIPYYQKQAQVLLVLIPSHSKEILTGKIFEYLAAKRPIMAIGPAGGDLESLLSEIAVGKLLPFDSEQQILEGIKWFWEGYKNSWQEFDPKSVHQYSRVELTRKMAEIMDKIVTTKN